MQIKKIIELILLLIYVSLDGIYYSYTFFYNYHCSYVRQVHPQYSETILYVCTLSLYIGVVSTNFIIPHMLRSFGIYRVIQINGLVIALSMTIMVYCKNIFFMYLAYFLSGSGHQIVTYTVIMVISTKFPNNKVRFTGYVFSGSSIAFLIWSLLSNRIVNPLNIPQTETAMTPDGMQPYFPEEVTKNYPKLCFIYGLTNVVFCTLISWLLPLFDNSESQDSDLSNEKTQNLISQSKTIQSHQNKLFSNSKNIHDEKTKIQIFSSNPIPNGRSFWYKRTIESLNQSKYKAKKFKSLYERDYIPMYDIKKKLRYFEEGRI